MTGKDAVLHIPRLLIAGTHSGVGKTTIATGIMASLAAQGWKVQGYKVGPDYIDPGYHTAVTGRVSRNLDSWMLSRDTLLELFSRSAAGTDVAVIEGVMGLYDGLKGVGEEGSTAQLAKWLQVPVILVVDVGSQARSAAAMVKGFQALDEEVKIAGVILNRVGSTRHGELVKQAIEYYCGIPVVGVIGKNQEFAWKERHLGLVPVQEDKSSGDILNVWGRVIEQGIDFAALLDIAHSAVPLPLFPARLFSPPQIEAGKIRIGVARDEAFHFYYQDGLDLLQHLGAEIVYFSPLRDKSLPLGISGLIIGGGFPELFLPSLAENRSMLRSIREANDRGMPIYAECGGFMYLNQLIAAEGKSYSMVALVPGICRMEKRLVGMGYVEAVALRDNLLTREGETLRGHVFHYSRHIGSGNEEGIFKYHHRRGEEISQGYGNDNLLASYLHFHWASHPQSAIRFLQRCQEFMAGDNK